MSFTGRPNAAWKSNPTQPRPRLCGSPTGFPCTTGPGYPIETQEYFVAPSKERTSLAILRGVIVLPEGILATSRSPGPRTLMFVPPISTTRIVGLVAIVMERAFTARHPHTDYECAALRTAEALNRVRETSPSLSTLGH